MVTVTSLVEQLLNGLTVGMVYVLLAAGLSIIFGVMDVINFSHGELFALGAYFAISIAEPFGTAGFWVALVVAPILVGVVGAVIERTTIRPLYGRDPLYHILLTFGLVLIINDLITIVWGTSQQQFSIPALLDKPIVVFGFGYSAYNFFMIGFGAALAVGTWVALNRTKYGMIVRAGSQDREMVRNLGIDIDKYYTLVFGFGAALAAVGGIVLGAYQNVSPGMGSSVIIPAFIVVVLGGLGSFRGAVLGGLLVGLVQTVTRVYVPALEGLVVFLLMIGVLLVKPQGLFGNPEWQSEHSEDGELLAGGGSGVLDPGTRTRIGVAVFGMLVLVPVLAVLTGYTYAVTLFNNILVWALFALSLDFVMGYAGLVSLGHAVFYGVGAYTAALIIVYLTPSLFVAVPFAILVTAVLAWVIGALSIRVSGVYFAMITLAFAQLFYNAVFKLEWAGGSDGLVGLDAAFGIAGFGAKMSAIELQVAGVTFSSAMVYYYLALVTVTGAFLLARRFMQAPFGSVLQAIRESDERTQFVGYDVTAYKRRAFVVSGALAGLAGALFTVNPNTFIVAPTILHWINSGEVIVMTILGGMGTLYGPMLGAGVFIAFEDVLSTYIEQWRLVLGVVFVLFVLFVPRGLVSVPELVSYRFGDGRAGEFAPEDVEVKSNE